MIDKTYIYLDTDLAEKIKSMDDDKQLTSEVIDKHFQTVKNDIKQSLDSLNEDVLEYKVLTNKARQAFTEATEEILEKSYTVWAVLDEKRPYVSKKIKAIQTELLPIKEDLQDIETALNKINTYRLGEIIKLVTELNSMSNETKKMMQFLMSEYRNK